MTDLSPPQRNQVGAQITMFINQNRQALGRELMTHQMQPVYFNTKSSTGAPSAKPSVSVHACAHTLHYQHLCNMYIHTRLSFLQSTHQQQFAAQSGDQLQGAVLPLPVQLQQAGLSVSSQQPSGSFDVTRVPNRENERYVNSKQT